MNWMAFFSRSERPLVRSVPPLAWMAALCIGCSASGESLSPGADSDGTMEPPQEGGTGNPSTQGPESIEFVPPDRLLLSPGQEQTLSVQVHPKGFHPVSFSLIAGESNAAFDGFLRAAQVVTTQDGLAENTLTAPSSPGLFRVRASVGSSLLTERSVSVGEQGFATLVAVPSYSGVREVASWTASAKIGVSCAMLESMWEDGTIQATSADQVALEGLPVGPVTALIVRAGHYVSGCSTVENLESNETRTISVTASDRPLQLDSGSFPVVLDIEEKAMAFVETLAQAAEAGTLAFSEGRNDAETLLADMSAVINDTEKQDAFIQNQQELALLDAVSEHLASPDLISDTIHQILLGAAASIDGPRALIFTLQLKGENALLVLESAAGVPSVMSGFLGSSSMTMETQPNDVLVLGGDLKFQPTQWLTAIAERSSDDTFSNATPVEEIAQLVDCAVLAEKMAAQTDDGEIYPECDPTCAENLCAAALEHGWLRLSSSGKQLTTLRVGITGTAKIDDEARPVSLAGTWVGRLDSSDSSDSSVAGHAWDGTSSTASP